MITKLSLSLIGQDHCVISLLINLHFSHWFPISTLHVSRADPKARLHDTEARHYARHARHARQPAWQILEAVTVSTESLIIPFMKNPTYRISIIVEQSEFDDGESLKLNFVFNFHLGKSSTWYLRRYLRKLSRISSTPFRLQLTLGPRHRQTPRLPSFPSFSLQLQRQQAALFSVAP